MKKWVLKSHFLTFMILVAGSGIKKMYLTFLTSCDIILQVCELINVLFQ